MQGRYCAWLEARRPEVLLQAPNRRYRRGALLRLPPGDGTGVGTDRPSQVPLAQPTMCAVQHQAPAERRPDLVGTVPEEIRDGRVMPDVGLAAVSLPIAERKAVDAQLWRDLPLEEAEFQTSALQVVAEAMAVLKLPVNP